MSVKKLLEVELKQLQSKVYPDFAELELELNSDRMELRRLLKLKSENATPLVADLEEKCNQGRLDLGFLQSEKFRDDRRIEELKALLNCSENEIATREVVSTLEAKINSLGETELKLNDAIQSLQLEYDHVNAQVTELEHAHSKNLLAKHGVPGATATKLQDITPLRGQLSAINSALAEARDRQRSVSFALAELKKQLNDEQHALNFSRLNVARMQHSEALASYLPAYAGLVAAERAAGLPPTRIDPYAVAEIERFPQDRQPSGFAFDYSDGARVPHPPITMRQMRAGSIGEYRG